MYFCSDVRDSQQPISPIGFLFLKLSPPPRDSCCTTGTSSNVWWHIYGHKSVIHRSIPSLWQRALRSFCGRLWVLPCSQSHVTSSANLLIQIAQLPIIPPCKPDEINIKSMGDTKGRNLFFAPPAMDGLWNCFKTR